MLRSLIRYFFVGLAATSIHYIILIYAVNIMSFPPGIAAGVGAFFGALFAYAGNIYFTFQRPKSHITAFKKFMFVAVIGMLFNGITVWVGSTLLGINYLIVQITVTVLVFFLTFQFNRRWTFKHDIS